VYGLEFAKSLHMDQEFLDTANMIRKTLSNEPNKDNNSTSQKPSLYLDDF
jgi:DNA mismatch repair protein MutS